MKKISNKEKEVDATKNNEWVDWQRKEEVTAKEVICAEGMSHLTNGQAEEVTLFIKTLSGLLYNLFEKENKEDPKIIDRPDNRNNKEAA